MAKALALLAVAARGAAASCPAGPDEAPRTALTIKFPRYSCETVRNEFKARMAVKLAVAGAFHTDFMAPAVSALSAALADTDVKAPRIPVVSNVDAAAHADPAVIKDLLAKQVTSPVLFEDSVANLLGAGFAQGYELGPGKVIAGIFKRIDKTASVENVVV